MKLIYGDFYADVDIPKGHLFSFMQEYDLRKFDPTEDFSELIRYLSTGMIKRSNINKVIEIMNRLQILSCDKYILYYINGRIDNFLIMDEILRCCGTLKFLHMLRDGQITTRYIGTLDFRSAAITDDLLWSQRTYLPITSIVLDKKSKFTMISLFANTLRELSTTDYYPLAFNSEITTLTNLRKLHLRNCGHEPVVAVIRSLTNLTDLDIEGTRIDDVNFLMEFTQLKKLNISGNFTIESLGPSAPVLEELNISRYSRIGDVELRRAVNLKVLNARYNKNVTTVEPFAKTLIKLDASGTDCGIDDAGLSMARNIQILNASLNQKITTISPFGNSLIELDVSDNQSFGNSGLKDAVALRILNVSDNQKVTRLDSCEDTLEELIASGHTCGICNTSLEDVHKLKKLNVRGNGKITTITPFKDSLEELDVSNEGKMTDAGLRGAKKLRVLNAKYTDYITTVEPFAETLEELYADCSKISGPSIMKLKRIRVLEANQYTLEVPPTVEELRTRMSSMDDSGLSGIIRLRKLDIVDNLNITTLAPFANTLTELICNGREYIGFSDLKFLKKLEIHRGEMFVPEHIRYGLESYVHYADIPV